MKNKKQTLADYLGISLKDIEQTTYNDNEFETPEGDYLVVTDEEANTETEERIKETLWAFNASFIINYADIDNTTEVINAFEKMQSELCESANPIVLAVIGGEEYLGDFVATAIDADGRGHFLSSYDGEEVEQGEYFIYRTN